MIENKRRNTTSWLRTLYDLTMGVLWLAVGVFVLFSKKLGYDLKLDTVLTNVFGISSILYGLFRIYRGVKFK